MVAWGCKSSCYEELLHHPQEHARVIFSFNSCYRSEFVDYKHTFYKKMSLTYDQLNTYVISVSLGRKRPVVIEHLHIG